MEYKVKLNWTNRQFRKLSTSIFIIALIGYCFSYLIHYPIKQAPSEVIILYYIDLLPKWIFYISGGAIIAFIISFLTYDIRNNTNGILRFDNDSVSITTKKVYELILFNQLKRIIFIVKPFSFHPYRIEFKYYNDKVKRVIIKSEYQFHQIIQKITELKPEELEIDFGPFESVEK
jgi:hypothetical protein